MTAREVVAELKRRAWLRRKVTLTIEPGHEISLAAAHRGRVSWRRPER